jgi:hypothetical protein
MTNGPLPPPHSVRRVPRQLNLVPRTALRNPSPSLGSLRSPLAVHSPPSLRSRRSPLAQAHHRFGSIRSPSRLAPLALGLIGKLLGRVPRAYWWCTARTTERHTEVRSGLEPSKAKEQAARNVQTMFKVFSHKGQANSTVFLRFCGSVTDSSPQFLQSAIRLTIRVAMIIFNFSFIPCLSAILQFYPPAMR